MLGRWYLAGKVLYQLSSRSTQRRDFLLCNYVEAIIVRMYLLQTIDAFLLTRGWHDGNFQRRYRQWIGHLSSGSNPFFSVRS